MEQVTVGRLNHQERFTMTLQERERRYRDWELVYVEEVFERVKHWGDGRKRQVASLFQPIVFQPPIGLDKSLFEPGR